MNSCGKLMVLTGWLLAVPFLCFSQFIGGYATDDVDTFAELSKAYQGTRSDVYPLYPYPFPVSLKEIEKDLAAETFEFQDHKLWYFNHLAQIPIPYQANSEIGQAVNDGDILIVVEDVEDDVTRVLSTKGEVLATLPAENWPALSSLQVLADELQKRRLVWVVQVRSPQNLPAPAGKPFASTASVASMSSGGGGMMAMMGGGTELEVDDVLRPGEVGVNAELFISLPTGFTNRVEVFETDNMINNGTNAIWTQADSGLVSTDGTLSVHWVDEGQLGRLPSSHSSVLTRFYTAASMKDSDGDGYTDGFEIFVNLSDPDDADSDNDNISDGPFDPDGSGSIVAGPDPFPNDAVSLIDTDGDGIADHLDNDDDGDGLADGSDPEPLIPITIAPFKVCSVLTTNPPGSDNGLEAFDISSAGRMLPYATGGNALTGFGRLFGGIYLNHDGTNLYIGVAGYSKNSAGDGEDALLLLLDTGTGGVNSLSAITTGPKGLRTAANLNFQTGTFEPDVAILVGDRDEDGRNNPTAFVGANEIGQGVYRLSGTAATDLTPAFDTTGPSPISQWGDSPVSSESANAGIEVAIPLTNLLDSAWSLTSTTHIRVAAIVLGGDNGTQRFLSSEAYGESVSGSFGFTPTTLIGAQVYLSPQPAPIPSTTELFTDSEVMVQGFGWDVPRPPESFFNTMTVAGSFNGWNPGLNNMTLIGDDTWEYIHDFTPSVNGAAFKFAADGAWTFQWGENNQTDFIPPILDEFAEFNTGDIILSNTLSGLVRFRFNNGSQLYSVETVTSTNIAYLPGFGDRFWYTRLQGEIESNEYVRFSRVWMNPAHKGKSGVNSVGYDPIDLHDLGTYNQQGGVRTRYGTEDDLQACMDAFIAKGIDPLADLVLNHVNGGSPVRYNFEYNGHATFEKLNTSATETNGYFNVNYINFPFEFDFGFGLPGGVNASDPYPDAHSADVNERHPYMRSRMIQNGSWLQSKAGYRGARFDYTQGLGPDFIAQYMRHGLMKDRFAVGEYWAEGKDASPREHQTWIALMDNRVCSFDFPLHEKLKNMCNFPTIFDMEELAHGALIHVAPDRAVTFVETHDEVRPFGTGSPAKLGMISDKQLAYAFILISEGHPCVFRQDYIDAPYADEDPPNDSINDGWTGTPLKPFIDPLIDARKKYAGGSTTYLSTANKNRLFIMKRNGTTEKDGCILTLNNHLSQTLTNTVNTGWTAGTVLVDVLETNHTVTVQSGGMAPLSANNRNYRVYVRQTAL